MNIEFIKHGGERYPKFQSEGNAAQFAIPFAKHFCIGEGLDIGCGKPEWAFPDAFPVDPEIDAKYDAMNLPGFKWDYIFSSHCLEHLLNWVEALDYWTDRLRMEGILFLYLPDFSQTYWRPWSNRKHKQCFTPDIIRGYFEDSPRYRDFLISGVDLNNSFMVVAEKWN